MSAQTPNKSGTNGVDTLVFLARQPIFDREHTVQAYELLFRSSEQNCFPQGISDDEASAKLLFDLLFLHDIDTFTEGKLAFINISTSHMKAELPRILPAARTVIEIVERAQHPDALLPHLQAMKQNGCRFALDDYDSDPKWEPLLPEVQFVKLEVEQPIDKVLYKAKLLKARYPQLKIVVERIEDYETLLALAQGPIDYYQGFYFATPEMLSKRALTPSKLVLLQLIAVCATPDPDFNKLAKVIEKDVALTARFLRLANQTGGSKAAKIKSLAQALVYLGQQQLRQVISLLALAQLGESKPMELSKVGLVRARFCQLLLGDHHPELSFSAYLVGLLSVLEAILDSPLAMTLPPLGLDEACELALSEKAGLLGECLSVAMAYERADWLVVDRLCQLLQFSEAKLLNLYSQALLFAEQIFAVH